MVQKMAITSPIPVFEGLIHCFLQKGFIVDYVYYLIMKSIFHSSKVINKVSFGTNRQMVSKTICPNHLINGDKHVSCVIGNTAYKIWQKKISILPPKNFKIVITNNIKKILVIPTFQLWQQQDELHYPLRGFGAV